VQSAHTAREAAVNALSRAERRERDHADRKAERAEHEKSAAAAAKAAAERAARDAAEERESADRLAMRLQRVELLAAGGLREAPVQPAPPVLADVSLPDPVRMPTRLAVPLPVPLPMPAPVPPRVPPRIPMPRPLTSAMRALVIAPTPHSSAFKLLPVHMRPLLPSPRQSEAPLFLPPPPFYMQSPDAPSPILTSPRVEDFESSQNDDSCIVCMDADCSVTTTCCSRTFMCAACSTRVMRCPLCSSVEFVCLPDDLL
jgi:hypothetical protein